jgi:hypothetical protein
MPEKVGRLEPRDDARPGMYGADVEDVRRNFKTVLGWLTSLSGNVETLLGLMKAAETGDRQALDLLNRVGLVATAGAKRTETLTDQVKGLDATLVAQLGEVAGKLAKLEEALTARADADAKEARDAKSRGANVAQRIEGKIDEATNAIVAGQQDLSAHVLRSLEDIRRSVAASGSRGAQGPVSTAQVVDRTLGRLGKAVKDRAQTKTGRRTWLTGRCRIVEAGGGGRGGADELLRAIDEAHGSRPTGGVAVVVAVGAAADVAQAEVKVTEEAARQRTFVITAQSLESFVRTADASSNAGSGNGAGINQAAVATDLANMREKLRGVGEELKTVGESGKARHRIAELLRDVDSVRAKVVGSAPDRTAAGEATGAAQNDQTRVKAVAPATTDSGGAGAPAATPPAQPPAAEEATAEHPSPIRTEVAQSTPESVVEQVAGAPPNTSAAPAEREQAATVAPMSEARPEEPATVASGQGHTGAGGGGSRGEAQAQTNRQGGQQQQSSPTRKQSLSKFTQPPEVETAAATVAKEALGRGDWATTPAEAGA